VARLGAWTEWLPPAARPPDVLLLLGNLAWSRADVDSGRQCESIHHGRMPRFTKCMCGCCHQTGEQAEHLAHQHGEAIGSRIDPDWHADATVYDPGNLKGGKG
jgi:hypothetical protein